MMLRKEWNAYLHDLRRREINMTFERCPRITFRKGLELGAGDGFQSGLLIAYVAQLKSTDINLHAIKKVKTKRLTYLQCDAEEVSNVFSKNQFDIVFSSNMLEHVPNPNKALRSIYEVLKDDGITIHIMPSPFWKLCNVAFFIPHRAISLLEKISKRTSLRLLIKKIMIPTENVDNVKSKKTYRSIISRLLVPPPHGVSKTSLKEFSAFSKSRWLNEFKKADFEVIKTKKGPVASGYSFGLDTFRKLLELLGVTSEYIYICKKSGKLSHYATYF